MESEDKKPYTTPEIVLETELETRTGSPLDLPGDVLELDLFDQD